MLCFLNNNTIILQNVQTLHEVRPPKGAFFIGVTNALVPIDDEDHARDNGREPTDDDDGL